jgi:serine/threonine protein kinase/tetratricopeptide (TPR) repeat protein
MPVDSDRVQSVFLAAAERPACEARAAFLDDACGTDIELRRRVEALLRAHDDPAGFLERPALEQAGLMGDKTRSEVELTDGGHPIDATSAPCRPLEGPGRQIGPYKLLQQIGEGGMGTVYMAEQTPPVQRKVALKIIKPGMDSRHVIACFEAERQALALMDHPSIAKVLDAGATDSGQLYFVMELVKGAPITEYCDAKRLTPRERLELFIPVCQAVQHAHQKGVIHRDLKPSNVLIALYDGEPVPKIIDFGVVKATGPKLTERTLYTEFGALVGTLEYMSPELAELNQLDVDTRSDIYSLGVLLYELLTGTTPLSPKRLKESALWDVLKIIREQQPPKPSTRLSTAEELPAIAAKRGMEPRKLSGLVRGELDWIVMKALEKDRNRRYETANGVAMDLQRFLRDEPVLACPPTVGYRLGKFIRRNWQALAMLSVVGAASLVAAGSLGWSARSRALQQTLLKEKITRALQDAEQFCKAGRLPEAVAALNSAEQFVTGSEAGEKLQRHIQRCRADLEMAAKLDEIDQRRATNEADAFGITQAAKEFRNLFHNYGLDIDSSEPDGVARRIRGAAIRDYLITGLDEWLLTQWPDPQSESANLLAILGRADHDPWRNQVRAAWGRKDKQALARLAHDSSVLEQPPSTLLLLAKSLGFKSALGLDLLRQAQRRYPSNFWLNLELGFRLVNGSATDAIGFLRAAVSLRPQSAVAHLSLGNALSAHGDCAGAEAEYLASTRLKSDYDLAHRLLGGSLEDRQRFAEAAAAYREAIRLSGSAEDYGHLAIALCGMGKLHDARAALETAFRLEPDRLGSLCSLAEFLAACPDQCLRDPTRALELSRKAVKLYPETWGAWQALGWSLYCMGQWRASIQALEKSCALQGNPERGDFRQWYCLAMGHCQLGNHAEARAWYDRATNWLNNHRSADERLRSYRAQAAALLRINEQPKNTIGTQLSGVP